MKLIFLFVLISCLAVLNSTQARNRDNNFVSTRTTESNENDPTHESHVNEEDPHSLNEKIKHFLQKKKYIASKSNVLDEEPLSHNLNEKTKYFVQNAKKTIEQNRQRKEKYHFNDDEVNPQQALKEEGIFYVKKVPISNTKKKYLSEFTKDELKEVNPSTPLQISKHHFQMDPVLNSNSLKMHAKGRRRASQHSSSDSSLSSSSREMKDFKEEYRQVWMQKKFEAMNKSRIRGDKVNMLAARPWGVPCGDPNQHDMPSGNCMLAMECEPEFRIYRGDLFCGRTQYICCALQLTTYDNYQGFDVSFDDKSLSTDSNERDKDKGKSSKEIKKRKRKREQKKRRDARNKRKKKIKKLIKRIVKEIRRILDKQFRNGTRQRKRRTKQLKQFINDLKKQYRKDRQSVKDLHVNEMLTIDTGLMTKLQQMQVINKNFAANATFREVLLKGSMSKQVARMLLQAYPELNEFLEARRAGGGEAASDNGDFEYDVEYGYLYY